MDLLHRVKLAIVPVDRIHPHEIADPGRRARISERLQRDGVLRDPLMVGEVTGYSGYVLLDGTNRREALVELGKPHALVQIIDYADEHAVSLRTWSHATSIPIDEIIDGARRIPGAHIEPLAPLAVGDALRTAGMLAVVLTRQQQYGILRRGDELVSPADQLRQLVDLYEAHMERVDSGSENIEERAQLPGPDGGSPVTLVGFPDISRWQVVTMAMRRALIPAGITRHVIRCGRALRVNVPLTMLGGADLDQANAGLRIHLSAMHPRLYREPTILFDS